MVVSVTTAAFVSIPVLAGGCRAGTLSHGFAATRLLSCRVANRITPHCSATALLLCAQPGAVTNMPRPPADPALSDRPPPRPTGWAVSLMVPGHSGPGDRPPPLTPWDGSTVGDPQGAAPKARPRAPADETDAEKRPPKRACPPPPAPVRDGDGALLRLPPLVARTWATTQAALLNSGRPGLTAGLVPVLCMIPTEFATQLLEAAAKPGVLDPVCYVDQMARAAIRGLLAQSAGVTRGTPVADLGPPELPRPSYNPVKPDDAFPDYRVRDLRGRLWSRCLRCCWCSGPIWCPSAAGPPLPSATAPNGLPLSCISGPRNTETIVVEHFTCGVKGSLTLHKGTPGGSYLLQLFVPTPLSAASKNRAFGGRPVDERTKSMRISCIHCGVILSPWEATATTPTLATITAACRVCLHTIYGSMLHTEDGVVVALCATGTDPLLLGPELAYFTPTE